MPGRDWPRRGSNRQQAGLIHAGGRALPAFFFSLARHRERGIPLQEIRQSPPEGVVTRTMPSPPSAEPTPGGLRSCGRRGSVHGRPISRKVPKHSRLLLTARPKQCGRSSGTMQNPCCTLTCRGAETFAQLACRGREPNPHGLERAGFGGNLPLSVKTTTSRPQPRRDDVSNAS